MSFSYDRCSYRSKAEIQSIIDSKEFIEIFTSLDIYNVIIFGSFNEDKFNEESDIDIAIIGNEKFSFNDEAKITLQLEELLDRNIDLININDDNISNAIKIQALKSKNIIIKNELLDIALEFYDNLYKDNQEFWFFLDREVLGFE